VSDLIFVGSAPNDGTGDDLRTICTKVNSFVATATPTLANAVQRGGDGGSLQNIVTNLAGKSGALSLSDIGIADYITAQSIGLSGYRRWASGFMEVWATNITSGFADFGISFPLAFPNACLHVSPVCTQAPAGTVIYQISADTYTKTGCSIRQRMDSGGTVSAPTNLPINYRAIGY
jgi:hypothetical protein